MVELLLLAITAFGNIIGSPTPCCPSKTVGVYTYTLVNSTIRVPHECLDMCVYIRDDQLVGLYCFASGPLPVHCNDNENPCLPGQSGYTYPQQGYTYPQQGYTYPQQGYTYPQQGYTYPQQSYTVCTGPLVVRQNVSNITAPQTTVYNNALKTIKDYPNSNEASFENIGNYHGRPWMCNNGMSNLGNYGPCCINHQGKSGFDELFTPWHRLYTLQMELALNEPTGNNLGMPYWDWTQVDTLPDLAQQGEWLDGPIKGVGRNTHRGFRGLDSEALCRQVKTAYIQTTTWGFNGQIVNPHNTVHSRVGGDMNSMYSSYDPIFYLHHSEIDYQYAFWQELQRLRGIPVVYHKNTWKMQPFVTQPPNPFKMTRSNPTAPDGLDYEGVFCYKYDKLLFKDKTPEEFLQMILEEQKSPSYYAGYTIKKRGVQSEQYFNLLKGSDYVYEDIGPISTFVDKDYGHKDDYNGKDPNNYLYDVTYLQQYTAYDYLDKTLHFEVSRYEDYDGNPLPVEDTYKPVATYRKPDTDTHVVRFHVNHIERYSPNLIHCHLDSIVEFLESDGSYSRSVMLDSDETGKQRSVVGDFPIRKLKNRFVIKTNGRSYESTYINVGYHPGCHVQCDCNGLPTSDDPSIIAVPWNLNWIKSNENLMEISNCKDATVIVAWCHGQETDVVEVNNKDDFDNCNNQDYASEEVIDSDGNVDGFIAIQHTQDSAETFYFASKSLCRFGFKMAIEITEC